jgi:mercuric resistance transcriptional repressor protein MerD
VDYEPVTNYTDAHAAAYAAFLGALCAALRSTGRRCGMDIAGWTILGPRFWQHYVSAGVQRFTSMTPTYDATNLTENRVFVAQALAQLPRAAFEAGIGLDALARLCRALDAADGDEAAAQLALLRQFVERRREALADLEVQLATLPTEPAQHAESLP